LTCGARKALMKAKPAWPIASRLAPR
jgi:hypothetical protein